LVSTSRQSSPCVPIFFLSLSALLFSVHAAGLGAYLEFAKT